MVRNYTYLNLGLTFNFNGNSYVSKNGLLDLLNENMTEEPLYAPIHLSGDDIEVAIAHGTGYGELLSRSSTASTPRRAVRIRRLSERPSPRPSRSSTTRTTTRRTSARRSSPPFRSRSPTRSSNRRPRSSSDRRRSSRACRCAISSSISWASTSTTTCTSIPRRRRCSSGKIVENEKGAQSHFGHPEEGARDGQEGFAQQQEIARLQDTPHRQARAGRTVDDLHHRGQLGLGFDHQEPRCARRPSFRCAASRSTATG